MCKHESNVGDVGRNTQPCVSDQMARGLPVGFEHLEAAVAAPE